MSAEKKCAWYADYEGVCTNDDSPYCAEWCPISGELGMCRFDKPNGAGTPKFRRPCPPPSPRKPGMPTGREALWKLFVNAQQECRNRHCATCDYWGKKACFSHLRVDHLIANGASVQRWIPVEELLPKEGQEVIACVLHRFGDKTVSTKTFWNATYANWQDVTHWMPLPEAPREDE